MKPKATPLLAHMTAFLGVTDTSQCWAVESKATPLAHGTAFFRGPLLCDVVLSPPRLGGRERLPVRCLQVLLLLAVPPPRGLFPADGMPQPVPSGQLLLAVSLASKLCCCRSTRSSTGSHDTRL